MAREERKVVLHQGVYKTTATVSEAVFMITGMTIGAGVLGLPYVISRVGILAGLVYIFMLGVVMLFLNLMVGEITVRTGESLQIPGLAGRYLGKTAKRVLSFTIILSGYGTLLAYIIGEGRSLSALFGGDPRMWSVIFWTIGSVFVWLGLQTVKSVAKVLSLIVMSIIVGLSIYLLPHVSWTNVTAPTNWINIFLPYGVILFALHATPAVIEAHALLPRSQKHFKRALILGTMIPIVIYMFFSFAVVGVMGLQTTEVATIGLGQRFGSYIAILANLFAILAMGTGFFGFGVALKQVFMWDHKWSRMAAELGVVVPPLLIFAFGITSFVAVLDTVGGLFIGVEALALLLIFLRARAVGDLPATRYKLHLLWIFLPAVGVVFTLATTFSVLKIIGAV